MRFRKILNPSLNFSGLWDFAWWVYQEVNFSPRITQITLIFLFFRVNSRYSRLIFGSTMRNPKEPIFFRVNSRHLS